jgi:methionyl-tRNA formyltransferase
MIKSFAYFGTPYVASDTLAYLLEHGYRPSVVITSPDAPRGRGLVLTPCETKVLAIEHGIPILTPEKITDEVIAEIAAYGCDYGIVVAYGKILPESLIQAFPLGLMNVHYSLLPKYRGASPVESALRSGDSMTGVAIQQLVYQLDAGDILASVEVPIESNETTRELRPRLVQLGAELLVSLLPSFESGTATRTPQDHAQATRCGKILKSEGELNLEDDGRKNWNTYRALAESPGTYFFADRHGKRVRVKILTASFNGTTFTPDRVIPEGKQEMSYKDFAR